MVRRIAAVSTLVVGLICAGAIPAWAHVTVAPDSAPKGGSDVQLTFRVPNEEKTNTTKVEIFIPSDPPLAGVLAEPVPGWTTAVVTTHLSTPIKTDDGDISDVVTQVTWTADNAASAIKPDDYQGFNILVGALPDGADQIVFKALQTYSDGTVVKWVDPVTEGGPEADHPTPILQLTTPTDSSTATTTPAKTATGAAAGSVKEVKDDADTAKTIGIIAIIFAVVALAGMVFSLTRKKGAA